MVIIVMFAMSIINGIISIGSFWGIEAFIALFNKHKNYEEQKVPERSRAFGYKQSWLCVSSENPSFVAKILGFLDTEPCDWKFGLRGKHGRCFISPPINGWIFVMG